MPIIGHKPKASSGTAWAFGSDMTLFAVEMWPALVTSQCTQDYDPEKLVNLSRAVLPCDNFYLLP
ncbi:hypothetical protein [Adhaeribacter pallidiroseus]|uniref:Uncharacterized protein n=1 Tax=Adhaeribacter pallidiroseus TaxID=2072847 RepID=A0A369QL15_9BACT|nr:hypothetical protein [Adhaeribacter pallidiroseus]RDC65591.1 hypothetical protein AHMF7616_04221 [Adhaeribacter pallidiroseus]